MSFGAVGFGFAPSFGVAFVGRLLVGFGASVVFIAVLRFCANWFRPDEFGTMVGLTFTVGVLGGLAATTPLAVAVSTFGWRTALFGLGLLGFVIAVGIVLLAHDTPEAASLQPLENVTERSEATAQDLKRHITNAAREPETWLLGVMLFFMTGISVTIFGLWGIPYLIQTYDISVTRASVYLLVGKVGGMIGSPLFGWVSDSLGRRTELIIVSSVVVTVAWSIFALFGGIPLLLVASVFFLARVLRGGIPLAFTVMKERHPEGASGTVIGLVNMMGWAGAAVFPVILGAALDAYWTGELVNGTRVYTEFGYRIAFAIVTAAGFASVLCALALHRRAQRERRVDPVRTEIPTD